MKDLSKGIEVKKRQRYSKEFVIEIMAEVANIGVMAASRKNHIPFSTVSTWLKEYAKEYEEIKIKTKNTFIAKANEVITKYLAHLLDENVIKATSGRDSAIIIGTLRDKISLEKGEPTERIGTDNDITGILWRKIKEPGD
jgi:transposase-like protein